MQSSRMYLSQEGLDSVASWVQTNLKNGATVDKISNGLINSERGKVIITKWYGGMDAYTQEEQRDIFTKYINENFKDYSKRSCVSPIIKKLMEENYLYADMDDYADFLTELLNTDGYQRVGHHITNIMACFAPYMRAKYPNEFENMNKHELEVELIAFIKEHLLLCVKNDK